MGLASRASPVHTALRNSTGDEGGPFGFGDQVTDPKPRRAASAMPPVAQLFIEHARTVGNSSAHRRVNLHASRTRVRRSEQLLEFLVVLASPILKRL